jgi:hypothetical protein
VSKRLTSEKVVQKFRKAHGDNYNYSLVDYENAKKKVRIICPKHGEFLQEPRHHWNGHGCRICGGSAPLDTEAFIARATKIHEGAYDYSPTKYTTAKAMVQINCRKHGLFSQLADSHLSGRGCLQCGFVKTADSLRMSTEEFIRRADECHHGKFTYEELNYTNALSHVTVTCLEHGPFKVWAAEHIRGAGCPYCPRVVRRQRKKYVRTGRVQKASGINSMRSTHPQLAEDFHPTKNGDLTPDDILAGTHKRLWWLCGECEHEWRTPGANRSRLNSGCPHCSGRGVHSDGRNSMRNTHPHLAEEVHSTRNEGVTPDDIVAGSGTILWWQCRECAYEWRARCRDRFEGTGCPVCANRVMHPDGRNSMAVSHPDLARDFHPNKNGDLTPENTVAGAGRRLWWLCSTCEHEWEATGSHRERGTGCPVCANRVIHSDGRNSLGITHPQLAREINPMKNEITSDDITAGSNTRLSWLCSVCNHQWEAVVANRSSGGGCPACAGQQLHIDGRNTMRVTHPHLAEELHPTKNGDITPDNIFAGAAQKLWWCCKTCGLEWRTTGNTRASGGRGCPACAQYGFNPTLTGYYYVISIRNEEGDIILYKGGISNEYERRFGEHLELFGSHPRSKDWNIEILEVAEFEDGADARILESDLLQEEIRAPRIQGLSSELFTSNPLDLAREMGWI